jgi:hypothetical protein
VHDLHATILHLLGLDHERLTYRHAGRDFRLTDVDGQGREGGTVARVEGFVVKADQFFGVAGSAIHRAEIRAGRRF